MEPMQTGQGTAAPEGKRETELLEDLLGGRVMAWVGGVAVLLGIAFLLAIAVSSGWIGEGVRAALGGVLSTVLLGAGIWLHERRGRTDAAVAALGAGVSGLFVTITVAAQVYELMPSPVGTFLAMAVGALATALAVRWESQGVAGLGILGALAAPVLAGADFDGGTVTILFVALAAAAGVLLWQRWEWLAPAAFAISVPQWLVYLFDGATVGPALLTLLAFGGLGVVVAVGHDLRVRAEGVELQSAFLLALNAIVVAGAGWFALESLGEPGLGKLWLAGMAAAHVAVGLAGPRLARVSTDLGLLSLVIGMVLADVAFGLVADGPVLAIGWAFSGVAFAALLKRTRPDSREEDVVVGGLGSHVALALAATLAIDDPLSVLAGDGTLSGASAVSVAALAAGCLVSARMAGERNVEWRTLLDGLGLSVLACLTALALDGTALVLAWTAEVAVLTAISHRLRDPVAGWGAVGFLALAAMHVLAHEAPPVSLVSGLADPLSACLGVGAVAAAALLVAQRPGGLGSDVAPVLRTVAGVAVLYLGSGLVVTPFESGNGVDSAVLSAHQQGQMVLSIFWALVGVATLAVGLQRDMRELRLAALALLGVAVVKVFMFDLATLTSVYRAVSFIGLGLLLLVGAFVWQRLRPKPLPDLRETPAALR